jgi:hypothetical protein
LWDQRGWLQKQELGEPEEELELDHLMLIFIDVIIFCLDNSTRYGFLQVGVRIHDGLFDVFELVVNNWIGG